MKTIGSRPMKAREEVGDTYFGSEGGGVSRDRLGDARKRRRRGASAPLARSFLFSPVGAAPPPLSVLTAATRERQEGDRDWALHIGPELG